MNENNINQNRNDFKGVYLIVLTIVVVAAIHYGVGIRFFRGASMFGFGSRKTVSYNETCEEFTSIDINAAIGDIRLVSGSDYSVAYVMPDNIDTTVKVKNGTLAIVSKGKGKVNNNGINNKYKITITMPEGTKLDGFTADLDLGNLEFSGFDIDTVDIKADLGNVELEDGTFGTVKVKADLGNIELKRVTAKTGNMDASMGNISISGSFSTLTADCNMGSVSYDTKDDISEQMLDLSCDMGSVKVNGEGYGRKYNSR